MNFLTVKHGGLPTWAWIAIGAAGLGVGLWLRRRATTSSSAGSVVSSAAPSGTSYPDLSAAGSGGATAAPVSSVGGYGASDLIGAYEQGGSDAATNFSGALGLVQSLYASLGIQPGVSGVSASSGGYTPPSGAPAGPQSVPSSTTTAIAKAKAAPFGGITSTRKLKSGATLTTYASGRIVEQAPGKSAYVVHK